MDTITGRSTTISGSKIITYAITPHTVGDYEVPSIAFSYFNPQTGKYVTLHTDPVKLHVTQGKHYNPSVPSSDNSVALKDIHDIAAAPLSDLTNPGAPLMLTAGYWSSYILPILAFAGILVYRRRNDELSKDTTKLRHKRANKVALQRLVTAKKLLAQNDNKLFYDEVSKAIWLYLSDKLNIPLSALSRQAAIDTLTDRKVPQEVLRNLESVIWDCETALYATGAAKKKEQTYADAVKVISDLEDTIK
jgi:hypothetical protein